MAEMTPEETRELDEMLGALLLPEFSSRDRAIARTCARAALRVSDDQITALRAERDALAACVDELRELRETNKRLNRRCQLAEAAALVPAEKWMQRSRDAGRVFAYESGVEAARRIVEAGARAEQAEAERDAIASDYAALVAVVRGVRSAESNIQAAGDRASNEDAAEWSIALDALLAHPLPADTPMPIDREAFRAGFLATVDRKNGGWRFDGPSAADREPEAWDAWKAAGFTKAEAADTPTARTCPTCGGAWPCSRCTTPAINLCPADTPTEDR